MKFVAVLFVVLGLSIAAAPAAGPGSVTLTPGSLSFKQAAAACNGALGTVSFTLGHTRSGALAGVTEQVDTSSSGIDTITFDSGSKSATVVANAHKNSVTAKNVQVKWKNQLACIMPD